MRSFFMGVEIERKFLVKGYPWISENWGEGIFYEQFYLGSTPNTVRIRLSTSNAYITIKGPAQGFSRSEFEFNIPPEEALDMMQSLPRIGSIVSKRRWRVPVGGKVWDVDCFEGDNKGLMIAEIELSSEEETFERPSWIGEEVTDDKRYGNSSLAKNPWKNWHKD